MSGWSRTGPNAIHRTNAVAAPKEFSQGVLRDLRNKPRLAPNVLYVNSRNDSEVYMIEDSPAARIISLSCIGNSSADLRSAVYVDPVCFTSDLPD